ncbi:unnamed protein product [Arabis nemorensis]|uniref:RING-type E3 ubiquitin transferase n=1 Tax=Arabis nemorensis TaxID=586526 RepID=A0A565CA17_9BRAS|nr:unnamed protein product [Arabis nemorensis]
MRHLMTMIKVVLRLVYMLRMCGWWLDVCTIQMFGSSPWSFVFDDPDDEDGSLQFLVDDPVPKVARETLLETAVSVSVIFVSVSDPFTEIPAGMLLFQICISFIMEHFGLWTTIGSLLRCWFTGVGWALGLTDFLLPRPEDNIGLDNGNVEPDRPMAALPAADDHTRRSLLCTGIVKTDDEEQSVSLSVPIFDFLYYSDIKYVWFLKKI